MTPIIKDLDDSQATVNSDVIEGCHLVTFTIPPSHDGTDTVFGTAEAYIQYRDDVGDFKDFADGNDKEMLATAISRKVDAQGRALRMQVRTVQSGVTVIPRIFISGHCGTPKTAA